MLRSVRTASNDSGIRFYFEHESLHLILFHEIFLSRLSVLVHAAEFIYFELSSVHAYSALGKENRTRIREVNHRSDNDRQYSGKNKAYKSSEDIKDPLCEHLLSGCQAYALRQDLNTSDLVYRPHEVRLRYTVEIYVDRYAHHL